MDHATFSVNAVFFVCLVLHAFVKMGTFCTWQHMQPGLLAIAVGHIIPVLKR